MIVALVLSFIGMIFLESKMTEYATLELVIIVIAILLAVLSLIGVAAEARWSWPFSTILFALILANSVFLFVTVGAFVTFVLQLFVGIFGLLMAVLSIEDSGQSHVSAAPVEQAPAVEPYTEEASQVSYGGEKKKRSRKKKKK
jgi:hypothetical protein